jgi:glycerophosphoryl diester phosphodiesterase
MPTLHEVLEELPGALLNVDVKQERPDMVAAVLAVVRAHRAHERVLLTSFSAAVLARVRVLGYPGPTGFSRLAAIRAAFTPLALLRRRPLPGQRLQIPVRFAGLDLRRRGLIEKQHALGVAVDYWVVDDPNETVRLLELGADGIVADDPVAMAELFGRSEWTASWRSRHPDRPRGVCPVR